MIKGLKKKRKRNGVKGKVFIKLRNSLNIRLMEL